MPSRSIVATELCDLFKLLGHPDRIRLIEELRTGDRDVNSLAEAVELPATRVSQHLALLRAQKIVQETRDGRRRIYSLTQPNLARWIVDGLDFVEGRVATVSQETIDTARRLWTEEQREETA